MRQEFVVFITKMLDKRALFTSTPLAIIFSLFFVCGNEIKSNQKLSYANINFYLSILAIAFAFNMVLLFLWRVFDIINERQDLNHSIKKDCSWRYINVKEKYYIIFIWLILFLCWIPILFAAYPGFFCYDAKMQYEQFINYKITTHHPPIHTIFLGLIIFIGERIFNDFNTAVAFYMVIQMLIVSFCFAFVLNRLKKWNVSFLMRIMATLYFAFFPVISMFAMCTTKDTLFSAVIMVFVVLFIDIIRDKQKFFDSKKKMVQFIVISLLLVLLRNNAIYAFIPFALICMLFTSKKHCVKACAILYVVLILFFIITIPLYAGLGITGGRPAEMLCVPMQQLIRVYINEPETFSNEEKESLFTYIGENSIKYYKAKCADHVKNYFRDHAFNENPMGFIKLWITIGLRQPDIYIDSIMENTYYAWYPNSIIDGYNAKNKNLYPEDGTSYFEFNAEGKASFDSKIPWLFELYKSFSKEKDVYDIPVLNILMSLAVQVWLLFICIFYLLYKKSPLILPLLLLLLLSATVLLGPMILVRYFLYLYFLFPLFLCILFSRKALEYISN